MDGTGKYHPKQGNAIRKEYTWNAIIDKWILISPEALNTEGTISISNDSHEGRKKRALILKRLDPAL